MASVEKDHDSLEGTQGTVGLDVSHGQQSDPLVVPGRGTAPRASVSLSVSWHTTRGKVTVER